MTTDRRTLRSRVQVGAAEHCRSTTAALQEALLAQTDRATRYASHNLVNITAAQLEEQVVQQIYNKST